jgi:hypothetical protein
MSVSASVTWVRTVPIRLLVVSIPGQCLERMVVTAYFSSWWLRCHMWDALALPPYKHGRPQGLALEDLATPPAGET